MLWAFSAKGYIMLYYLRTVGLAFVLAVALAPLIIEKLRRLKFGQKILEDGPSWHKATKQNTPTMGGIIIVIAVSVVVLSFAPYLIREGDYRPFVMLGISLVFGTIGFFDDWVKVNKKTNKGLTAWQKLMLQIAAAALFVTVMMIMGYISKDFKVPFLNITISVPWVVYMAIAVFIVVGADNAVNLTDGIDGLCTSVTFVVSLFFAIMLRGVSTGAEVFALALCGALAGFFIFNKNPAKVFMGDTGSLFLGGAVCAMAFAYDMPLILAIVGIVYVIEVCSDIIQVIYFKKTGGKRIFKMAPIHHHFEMLGWSEWKIVTVATVITAAACALAYFA